MSARTPATAASRRLLRSIAEVLTERAVHGPFAPKRLGQIGVQKDIPIKTIDRSSGLIATDALTVGPSLAEAADCGKDAIAGTVYPTNATYNALVRGDSSHATVRITVRWMRIGKSRQLADHSIVNEECSTRATWETALERKIKEAAEAKGAR
jgi:hypothetical protein